ncbi:MAG: hypothetical protein DRJ52_02945 [Thermoprotei archaeon]|nr:MAG: hypothetical protein DRJ52_02945 [Thermoprotei archaeon]RLF01042.1 MAG: hypothetical protein DRJ63_00470 [Thermoprotei archaeon]HDI75246.1 hypothetical protein [Thermoprotei archaeon]
MLVKVSKENKLLLEDILCYPKYLSSPEVFEKRVKELLSLKIEYIFLSGKTQVGRLRVLGKGCTSIVVLALYKKKLCTLKIRRLDANRPSMLNEARNLRIVNALNIGPRLLKESHDFLLLKYINGLEIFEWSAHCTSAKVFRKVLSSLLKQCYLLDIHSIYHAELSNLKDHVIIDAEASRPIIIDFETVSLNSRRKVLPAVIQNFIYRRCLLREKFIDLIGEVDTQLLMQKLRKYKKFPRETFKEIYKIILN